MSAIYDLKTIIESLSGLLAYPLKVPQGVAYPAFSYQQISNIRIRSTTGPSGLQDSRVQFDLWGPSFKEINDIFETMVVSLDGFRGQVGSTHFGGIIVDDDRHEYDDNAELYRISFDLKPWNKET